MEQYTKKIQQTAAIGLWGSAAIVIVTAFFSMVSPWHFIQNEYTAKWMLVAGTVLAVLAVSMALLGTRRTMPRLRQTDGLEDKLKGYVDYVRQTYINLMVVVLLLCLFTLLSGHNVLLMLAMVTTLVLVLGYPNIYKVKVDLGLTDGEMRTLYGDRYISDRHDEQE